MAILVRYSARVRLHEGLLATVSQGGRLRVVGSGAGDGEGQDRRSDVLTAACPTAVHHQAPARQDPSSTSEFALAAYRHDIMLRSVAESGGSGR
jgi:hypothetical protein